MSAKLGNTLIAMKLGTKHGGTFNKRYAVCRAHCEHPEVFNPVVAKNDGNRRVEWLTYNNLNVWTDAVKKELIKLGVVLDKPGFISECPIE